MYSCLFQIQSIVHEPDLQTPPDWYWPMDARRPLIATTAGLSTVDQWVIDRWLPLDTDQLPVNHANGGNYPINPLRARTVCQLLTDGWPMVDQPANDTHGCWRTKSWFHQSVCQLSRDDVREEIGLSTTIFRCHHLHYHCGRHIKHPTNLCSKLSVGIYKRP